MDPAIALAPEVELVRRPILHLPGPADAHHRHPGQPVSFSPDGSTDPRARTASLAAEPGLYLPRRARHLALAACRAWGLSHLADQAALIADELVTNAVVHARTFIEFHLREEAGNLVVAVHDRDPRLESSWWNCAPPDDVRGVSSDGYGLCLVRRTAAHCGGYHHREGGKVMWAVLRSQDDTDQAGQPDDQGARDVPRSVAPPPVVRRTVLVNGVRHRVHAGRARWRLELLLSWRADDPEWVELSLRPTPLHPALPHGHWRVPLDILTAGLDGPSGTSGVRLYPDPGGQNVLLELPGDPPQVVHAPLRQIETFVQDVRLDDTEAPVAVSFGSSGGS